MGTSESSGAWEQVKIGSFAKLVRRGVLMEPGRLYRTMGVKWWGLGAYERETKLGHAIKASKMYAVRMGDLVINKIWVRHGSSGIVGPDLDGCVVTADFPTFEPDYGKVLPAWLSYLFRTEWFWSECDVRSRGTSGRQRIDPMTYLEIKVPLPPLKEQQRIVARIEALAGRVEATKKLQQQIGISFDGLLLSAFEKITANAPTSPMGEVAPLKRRHVAVVPSGVYPELGIRSFGRGTFHKPPVEGASVGTKRLFRIEAGDLLFSNVFSWEGAVAVARPNDHGRVGSHRFLTCVPKAGVATPSFLCFHFLTSHGLEQLGEASPGAAGRNRTLGLKALERIQVPIPSYAKQVWFDALKSRVDSVRQLQTSSADELESLFKSVLDKAFRGEL